MLVADFSIEERQSCTGNGFPCISTGAPVCTLYLYTQCCGSGSGTFLTPVSGMEKIRIWDEHPREFFRKLRISFLVLKYLNSLMGSGMGKFGSGI